MNTELATALVALLAGICIGALIGSWVTELIIHSAINCGRRRDDENG